MSSTEEETYTCNLIDAMFGMAKAILVMCVTLLIIVICPSLLRNWYVYQKDIIKRQAAETKKVLKKVFILPAVDNTGPRAISATDILSAQEYREMLVDIPQHCPSCDYVDPRGVNNDDPDLLTDEEMDEFHFH